MRRVVWESANLRASVWDLLSHPRFGDARIRSYLDRRNLLVTVLSAVEPPIQAVPATSNRDVALL
ncbi:hypothetical protein PUR57_02355 [Streptomyces sp. JV176]|uniref:hypothetical protein n=1 Tax=Streptomyces sp. JV176 TaxID=858630 RepID=UPI002E7A30A8|nr:hypothetical protein [Streptomyces sp. JV176]MEE1797537.1 hypothetical protein [Streptomyces sp. JV176]